MSRTYYAPGDWNVICDRCGFKYKASQMKETWDGLMVCKKDWEPRQPQDYVRGVKDNQAVPWTRPKVEVVFSDSATSLVVPPMTYG